jgi:hypothetical protein
MGLSITESRSDLLAEARAEFNRAAALKASITGEKAEPLPPDTVLIATDPTLSEEIQAADASSTVDSGGGAPMGGGPVGAAGASSSSPSTPTIGTGAADATGAATGKTAASSAQSGQLLNVVA